VAVALLSLASFGCSSEEGNRIGEGLSRVVGRALAPENGEAVPLANETVVLLTYDEQGDIVTAEVGTTDGDGRFQVDVEAQEVIALIVSGMTDEGEAEISGLYNPEADGTFEKDLDPATSIACVAGISAIGDGSISQEELDEARVQNLEDAAAAYIEDNGTLVSFDFYSESVRDAAIESVRASTDDGANSPE